MLDQQLTLWETDKAEPAERVASPVQALVSPPFTTVVADPPWPYRSDNGGGFVCPKPTDEVMRGHRGVENMGYHTMSMDELKALPVASVAADNAHLYLWTTNAFMVEAHDLARAWGFEPKTVCTWTKTKQGSTRPSMKTGYYFRGATEHFLFAVRGSLRLQGPPRPTAYLGDRLPHSVKPEWFYQLVEEQSPGPYLELFARRPRSGWGQWGNQIEHTATLEVAG